MLKLFQEFLLLLNDYRTTLPARLSHVTAPVDSIVREHAALARRRHSDLANRAQRLLDRLRTASDGSARYRDAVQRAQRWMQTVSFIFTCHFISNIKKQAFIRVAIFLLQKIN